MRVLAAIILPSALLALAAPACAGEALPDSGAAKLAAYLVCRPLGSLDMGAAGADSATECTGIVRNLDSQKEPDNLAIRCLESTATRPDAHTYSGACALTDSDGDKLFMTYDGKDSGRTKWIGGTGKYKDLTGAGTLGVTVAPGAGADAFAYTATYEVNWTRKAK